ncbi:thioesterase II family protein [Saccharothrix sp. HUAS TT1]|uniref:thioesterase II family protein n=1 Tax=unclassified Saccharothrix TaxID=2593673 RepID=UPI00345C31B8
MRGGVVHPAVDREAWVRRFHEVRGSRVRLVCLPHAGGSAPFFHPLSAALPPGVEALCVQYPGRQDRRHERPVEDIGQLADLVTAAVRPWADAPLALFGHSMGATLGFEVARRLEAEGVVPVALFCSGRRAPVVGGPEPPRRRDDDGLLDEVRELSGTDLRLLADEEVLRLVLPAIRADYRAIERYECEPGAAVGCPITALVGDADPRVGVGDADAWRDRTTGGFSLHTFTGGHFFLADHWSRVAEVIGAELRGVLRE